MSSAANDAPTSAIKVLAWRNRKRLARDTHYASDTSYYLITAVGCRASLTIIGDEVERLGIRPE